MNNRCSLTVALMSNLLLQKPNAWPVAGFGRGQLYAAVFALLIVNAIAAKVGLAVNGLGLGDALVYGLGLSWAFWLSFALCIRLALTGEDAAARSIDLWAAGACVAAALVPLSPASSLAATALGLFLALDRRQDPRLRAAAMILVAVAVQLLWSRLVMLVFITPIASLDAHLVSLIVGSPVHGNVVAFVHGPGTMSILGACTSVQNASVALMLFVAIVRTFRPLPVASEAGYFVAAFLSVVLINVARLALMAQNLEMFHLVHGDTGESVVNMVITLNGLVWAAMSVRREIFR